MTIPSVFMVNRDTEHMNTDYLHNSIRKAKAGDEQAFASLYTFFFKKIYSFIFFRVSHKELAEDLAEDVFIKAYSKLGSIKEPSSFEGWLYQIARNTVIDYYREKKMEVNIDELENVLEYESNIVDQANLHYDQQQILHLLSFLTSEQQMVIKFKFLEDLDNSEIAALMGKTEGAIRVIQHRALTKLQELVNNNPDHKNL